jgi:hypothetical protein
MGHDGKFFFVLGNDPLLLQPSANAALLDLPAYRAQRILYPAMAGLMGALPPLGVAWGMVVINVAALGLGTLSTAALARSYGASPWLGLAFALNLGLISELYVDGAGIVALALGVTAVLLADRSRLGWAIAMFSLAALAREVMLLMPLGLVAWHLLRRRPVNWSLLVVPTMTVLTWTLYVHIRLSGLPGLGEVSGITLAPFGGLLSAAAIWQGNVANVAGVFVTVGVAVAFAVRAWRSDLSLSWASLGFVALMPFLSWQVWANWFDISRAVAPVFVAFVVQLFSPQPGQQAATGQPAVTPTSV